MKIFYIENEKGNYFSTNRKRRFIRLVGKEAFHYLKKHRSQIAYFYPTTTEEDGGHLVFVEIPEESASKIRSDLNREKYVKDTLKKSPYVIISLFDQAEGEEELTVQDTVIDESVNVEDKVILEIELEMLRRALKVLSDDDLRIVYSMYLSDDPLSETKLSEILGIPRTTLMSHRDQIFSRLRRLFEII